MNYEAEIVGMKEQMKTLFNRQEEMRQELKTFSNLVTAVERIATQTQNNAEVLSELKQDLKSDIKTLTSDVKELKDVPKKRYENTRQQIINAILTAVIGGFIGIAIGFFVGG